jgi:phosphatidylglycerophosphate synthase
VHDAVQPLRMSLYRGRDLLLVPSLLSLCRVPLALVFVLVLARPRVAFAVLIVAALTDVLDGFIARRFGLETAMGAAIDPITDKVFVVTVVTSLVVQGNLCALDLLLLSTRELGELPLVVWSASSGRRLHHAPQYPRASGLGKAATTLQFVAIAAALFRHAQLDSLLWASAIGGMLAAAGYWWTALGYGVPQDR